ncbi:MAG TPA: hypothetical protein VKZ59_05305, partial [Acidobacteriota bacterium]|nr:hypothetical protein [Acidobacteriota bacterium]
MNRQIPVLILSLTFQVILAGGEPAAELSFTGPADSNSQAVQAPPGEERLRVLVGKSMVLNSPDPLKRISVT